MADSVNSSSMLGFDGIPQFFLVKTDEKHTELLKTCEKVSQKISYFYLYKMIIPVFTANQRLLE